MEKQQLYYLKKKTGTETTIISITATSKQHKQK